MMAPRTSQIPAPISVRIPIRRPALSVVLPSAAVAGDPRGPANDGATTIALHLAALRAEHGLDVLVVVDQDGVLLASAGDRDASEALARFASSIVTLPPAAKAEATRRVSLIVEHVRGPLWVAANAERSLHDGAELADAIRAVLPDEPVPEDEALAASLCKAFDSHDDDDPFADWLD